MVASRCARPLATLAFLLAATGLVSGCESRSQELQAGSYRAVLDLPDGQLPFGLDIAIEGERRVLYLVNGEERLRVEEVAAAEGRIRATLPGSGSTLSARVAGRGLEGQVELRRPDGTQERLPFRATPGQTWRFFETPSTDNADVAGRWTVTFISDRGPEATGLAEFRQSFEHVAGRIGGSGLLVGEMRGDQLYLSRFDGVSAELCRARVTADGVLVGELRSGGGGHRRFRAVRSPTG